MVPYQLSVPDDLPADLGRGAGDLPGQAGDAGVVVDLDVDLAADDLRLRLLLDLLRLDRPLRRGGLARPRVRGAGDRGDLALGRLLALGGEVGDPGHRDGDDAEDGDGRGERDAALVADPHGPQTSKPSRRAERCRCRAARSRRSRRTSSGSASSASGTVDQGVEDLVVAGRRHVELLADRGLLGAGVLPPLALELQDLAVAVAQARLLRGVAVEGVGGVHLAVSPGVWWPGGLVSANCRRRTTTMSFASGESHRRICATMGRCRPPPSAGGSWPPAGSPGASPATSPRCPAPRWSRWAHAPGSAAELRRGVRRGGVPGARLVRGAGRRPGRRRRLRRHAPRDAPRARPAGPRGRQARALREAADAQPRRGRADGRARRGARPVPDGGDVDGLPPGRPRGRRRAARRAGSGRRGSCTPTSGSSSTGRRTTGCATRRWAPGRCSTWASTR